MDFIRLSASVVSGAIITLGLCMVAPLMSSDRNRDVPELISPVQIASIVEDPQKPKEKEVVPKKILELPKSPQKPQPPREHLQKVDIAMQPLQIELAPTMAANLPVAPQPETITPNNSGMSLGAYDLAVVDSAPKLKRYMPPHYPPKAKGQGIEGRVIVRCVVSGNGRVQSAEVIEADPAGYFEQAAVRSVKKWSFTPAKYQGNNVAVYVDIPLSFSLD